MFLEYIKNIGRRKNQRGATSQAQGWRARPTPWARPRPCGPPGRPPVPIFGYMVCFDLEKIRRKLSGRSASVSRRNLGRTNLGLRRSCSAGETSLREGKSSPSSSPLILSSRGGQYLNIFTSTITSQTLVHLLYPILYQNHKLVPVVR